LHELAKALEIIGGLGVFLFGMKIMSEGLQKAAGSRIRAILNSLTGNRFIGVFTGLFVTAAVQSSSATTVMLVSFVNAGLVSFESSIAVIYGCEIGTTITAWIVALFGFKLKISAFALPMVGIGFFLRFVRKPKLTQWGEVAIGFGILFLGLLFMKEAMPDAHDNPQLAEWIGQWNVSDGFHIRLLVLAAGAIFTAAVQSSSAMIAMVLVMASGGLINFTTAAVLIIGANIGTTITALLASISAYRSAKRVALAHTTFNATGALWAMIFLTPFLRFADGLMPGDPMASPALLTTHLALVHTLFNCINTLLFLPFIKQMAALQNRILPSRKDESFQLRFIDSGVLNIPSLALAQSRQEVGRMMQEVREMFEVAMDAILEGNEKDLDSRMRKVERIEATVDLLERTLQGFLTRVGQAATSEEQSQEISNLIYNVSDLERIGDHCETLVKLTSRRIRHRLAFSPEALREIDDISSRVRQFLELIDRNIGIGHIDIMADARLIESQINDLRKDLRKNHILRLNQGTCGVDIGLIFIDMLTSFEKIGDHSYNIAESISGMR